MADHSYLANDTVGSLGAQSMALSAHQPSHSFISDMVGTQTRIPTEQKLDLGS